MTGREKMEMTPTPHDALFKQFLTQADTARDFLQIHLPAKLLQYCQLDTLQLASGSFIEKDLRALYSDVLYSLRTDSGDGYIYCLIEHQSSPDKHMALRLMRYSLAAMQRHLDQGHNRIPLVIPILFYHGQHSPYPYPMNWLQLFDNPQQARELFNENFPLVDVTVIPDNEIMAHRRVALLEFMQKHCRRQHDIAGFFEQLATLLQSGYNTKEQIMLSITYLLQVAEAEEAVAFIRKLAQHSPQHKEELMTIAEALRYEGRQEGHQEGMELGKQQEKLRIALALLANGLEASLVMKTTGLTPDELQQLRH
ncbi:Rpn family recombination-promoting nuclease/putative transposase [Pantoea sp. B65]|uniref:Rpn family recombination-promoting nuclease/putative transposase n=1 Tax=Pantoea sp. B65 TaxID=2813359 RepID=UPI0039B63DE6